MARIILKVVLWIIGIVLGLFLVVWILLQIPAVQNTILDKVTASLSQTLQTKVAIDRVNIRFFKTVVLEGIYLESQSQDTLLYARKLGVNIGLFDLLDNRIHVNSIDLDGATIHLYRTEADSSFNYQFILDAFDTQEPDTTASETVWTFGIDKIAITDSRFRMLDEFGRSDLDVVIGDFDTRIGELNLEEQVLDINLIRLENSKVAYRILEGDPPPIVPESTVDTTLVDESNPTGFPSIGWSLSLDRLRLQNNAILYDNANEMPIVNAVDFNHLDVSGLEITANNFLWRDSVIQGNIERIALRESSGFTVERLGADLEWNTRQLAVQDFIFQTPQSNVQANTTLTYNDFNDFLNNLTENVRFNLVINNSSLAFEDLEYFAPAIAEIRQLNTDLNKAIQFSARANGTFSNLNQFSANLAIENGIQFRAEGSASNLMNPEQLSFNINLQELSTSYNNLKRLTKGVAIPAALDDFGQIRLTGQFQGNLETINGQNVALTTESYTRFLGNLQLKQISTPENLGFNLAIRELRTQATDLNGFVEGGLPVQVQNLGQIRYVGNLSGNTTEFLLTGNLQTDAGAAITDFFIDFNKDYSNATYNGEIDLQNFNLERVMGDTAFGTVTLAVAANGSGLSLDNLKAELEGFIAAFDYRGYEYNDVRIDGRVEQQQFIGEASIQDANVAFAFNGNVNLNDSLPVFNFVADIDTVNLKQLHFYPTTLGFSGEITADFVGLNIDDLDGVARIANLAISNDTASYQTDSIVLRSSEPDTTGKLLTLQSDFINAQVSGNYNLGSLPKIIQNFVNDYFPVDQLLGSADRPDSLAIEPERVIPDQDFEALVEISDPVPLLSLFVAGMERLDTAWLSMRLDTKGRDLEIQSTVPQLVFQGNAYNNIRLEAQGTPDEFNSRISLQDLTYGRYNISLAEAIVVLGNDSLVVNLNVEEENVDSARTLLALGGDATLVADSTYRFAFQPRFVLNGDNWQIPEDNEILYRRNYVDINNFALRKDEQSIAIASADSPRDVDFAPIEINFDNFKIQEIFNLLVPSEDVYSGNINGVVTVRDYTANLNYLVDLTINDIALNEQPVGNLVVQAEQASSQTIQINIELDGQGSDATVRGTYAMNTQALDLQANLDNLELRLLDPFAEAFIEDSQGALTGNFTIRGTTTAPQLNGTLQFNNVSTILALTGVRYTIDNEQINITNQAIDFGTLSLVDDSNNRATLSGTVNYADFDNIGLNLNFNTDRFQLLNLESSGTSLYYGTLFVSADVSIRGTATKPVVNVVASTLDSTILYVQPLTAQQAIAAQEDYIIFANPTTFTSEDTTRSADEAYQINRTGIDLTLNLEITPNAELQIIIDPATGDKLVSRGNSDLLVEVNPTGDVNITGNYVITSGSYSLNYQGVLRREFQIRPGSRLDFVGDPLDTRFDVTATYTTRTPTYELIRNQVTALTPAQEEDAKTRTPVTVLLNMEGDLENPAISFDIQIGEGEADVLTSVTAQALARLRDNPTELNTQVFSLLLFNSFLSEQSGGGSLAETGASIYLSSVSSLLTNQLNRLANRLVKGVDINIGVESYQSEYDLANSGNTITELQLGLSKNLFNDRLTVQVGGNVNVNSENSLLVQGANFSSLAGNFVLEYKLTETGSYRLRVFRRDNYDVLNQTNIPQTGVGISFQKSFGGVKKSEKKRNSKRTKRDSSNIEGTLPENGLRIQRDH